MAAKFELFVDEDHSKLLALYWLPKLHKWPYKSRFIAQQFMKEMVKKYSGLLKIQVKFLKN